MRPRPQACPGALAFLSAGPYDVRPKLVAAYYGGDEEHTSAILAYGLAYVVAWFARRHVMFRDEVMRAAVAHGYLRLCRPTLAGSVELRAKQARIRAASFRLVSDLAADVFRQRLSEGAASFVEVAADADDPGPAETVLSPWADSAWWSRAESGRRNRVKLIELKLGSSRPPATPRAPSRDDGWLSNFEWAA